MVVQQGLNLIDRRARHNECARVAPILELHVHRRPLPLLGRQAVFDLIFLCGVLRNLTDLTDVVREVEVQHLLQVVAGVRLEGEMDHVGNLLPMPVAKPRVAQRMQQGHVLLEGVEVGTELGGHLGRLGGALRLERGFQLERQAPHGLNIRLNLLWLDLARKQGRSGPLRVRLLVLGHQVPQLVVRVEELLRPVQFFELGGLPADQLLLDVDVLHIGPASLDLFLQVADLPQIVLEHADGALVLELAHLVDDADELLGELAPTLREAALDAHAVRLQRLLAVRDRGRVRLPLRSCPNRLVIRFHQEVVEVKREKEPSLDVLVLFEEPREVGARSLLDGVF
mmetsp:Transcript_66788/g.204446  ORF Transcript_66788/g.204446 Transcript_66788/m.204446 type:complete len:340 (-) Transcript_66788:1233-2252(-)